MTSREWPQAYDTRGTGFVLGCRGGRDLNAPRGQQSREEDEMFASSWDRLPAVLWPLSLAATPQSPVHSGPGLHFRPV